MRRFLGYGAVIGMLGITSCTLPFNPNGATGINVYDCETEECVMDLIDTVDHTKGNGTRFKFMEGYPPQKLKDMHAQGRLKVHRWNGAAWTATTVGIAAASGGALVVVMPGMAVLHQARWGDMYSCEVNYAGIPGWQYYLEHELWHCLGYKERGWLPWQPLVDKYNSNQVTIMEDEGVSRWIDTRFYREQVKTDYKEGTFYFYMEDIDEFKN